MFGKCLYLGVLISLAVCGAALAGGAKEAAEADLKKLQGTWVYTSMEKDGKPMPAEMFKGAKITFTANKWSVTVDGKEMHVGTQKLDPTKKPAQIDATITEGMDKGTTMLGIYELKGDTVKVCFDPTGKQRPTSFTTKEGQGTFTGVCEREKKK